MNISPKNVNVTKGHWKIHAIVLSSALLFTSCKIEDFLTQKVIQEVVGIMPLKEIMVTVNSSLEMVFFKTHYCQKIKANVLEPETVRGIWSQREEFDINFPYSQRQHLPSPKKMSKMSIKGHIMETRT